MWDTQGQTSVGSGGQGRARRQQPGSHPCSSYRQAAGEQRTLRQDDDDDDDDGEHGAL